MNNDTVHFRVLLKNGDIPDIEQIAQNFEWAKSLMWMDMECFLIDENGNVYLSDEMGSFVWADQDMFRVEFPIEEMLRVELARRDEQLEEMYNQYRDTENNARAMIVENTMLHEKIIELNKKIDLHDDTIHKLKEENEQLIRSFCEYETICTNGEVGASVLNMKKRIDELENDLADRDDTIKKLNEKLHDETSQLEIAAASMLFIIVFLAGVVVGMAVMS